MRHIMSTRTDSGMWLMVASTDTKEAGWIATQIESYINRGLSNTAILAFFWSVSTSAPPFIDAPG